VQKEKDNVSDMTKLFPYKIENATNLLRLLLLVCYSSHWGNHSLYARLEKNPGRSGLSKVLLRN